MNNPLVSIIVTCYNRANMIEDALNSVWTQTYRPLELIIIDDGSKDNSMEVILKWEKDHLNDDNFKIISRSFPNGKLCLARNRGLELAHGEYVQYVDDDDWLHINCVEEKVMAFQLDQSVDVMLHQVDYCYDKIGIKGSSRLSIEKDFLKQLSHILDIKTNTYFSPTLMFRRSILINIGAWTSGLLFADDIDVVFRLAILGAKFGLVDKPLSVYNMHGDIRQCNNMIYKLDDNFWADLFISLWDFCKKHKKDNETTAKLLAKQSEFYAIRQIQIGKFRGAIKSLKVADELSGKSNWRLKIPSILSKWFMCIEYIYVQLKKRVKNMIKLIIRGK